MKVLGALSRLFSQGVAVTSPTQVIKAVDAANQASHKAGLSLDEVLIGHEAWPKAKLQAHMEASDRAAAAAFARYKATGDYAHMRACSGHSSASWVFYESLVRHNRPAAEARKAELTAARAGRPPALAQDFRPWRR